MTPQMSAHVIDVPASIELVFAASPLPPLKPLVWPWAVAATAVLSLLIGFYFVVREIEHQGERRRQAVMVHADATWRCNALLGRQPRASCLMKLNAPARTEGSVQVAAEFGAR